MTNTSALQIVSRNDTPRPEHLIRVAVPRLNKQEHISRYLEQLKARDFNIEWAEVTETRCMNCAEWNEFVTHLMTDRDWLAGKGGPDSWTMPGTDYYKLSEAEQNEWLRGSYIEVIAVVAPTGQTIYIDPQGYDYARYVAFAADPLPEPKSREELRRDRERAEAQARITSRNHAIENPPAVPADHGLRFFWNGIKSKSGKLERCHYSKGALVNFDNPEIISIYARDYNRFGADIRACFHVTNDSDSQSDYFADDAIRLLPNHPLYADVMKAYEAQEEHYRQAQAKREAKHRR